MEEINRSMVRELLADLKVELIIAGYNHVETYWKDLNYIPEYNKFYFILDGVGWLQIDGVDYYPKTGELYLMPQGSLQSYAITDPENTFTKYWIHFTAKIGEINLFDLIKTPLHINIADHKYVTTLFESIFQIHISKESLTDKIMLQAYLYQIISYYIENIDMNQIDIQNTSDLKRISLVIDYINKHIGENLKLEALASMVHLQPNYFIRIFKKYTHYSPMSYVNKLKMDHSMLLLKNTDSHIKEISDQLGFCNEFYFSKIFKKVVGFNPKQYRNMYQTTPKYNSLDKISKLPIKIRTETSPKRDAE